jgi:prepilin-type N-terminal cleavage/methylation domain-containing protein
MALFWHTGKFYRHTGNRVLYSTFMNHSTGRSCGFTLVEIMVVVAIIGLLTAIALPSFRKARMQTRASRVCNDLRIAVDTFEVYALEKGTYPPDVRPGDTPSGMASYTKNFDWAAPTEAGGRWDWDNSSVGITAGVTLIGPGLDMQVVQLVDEKIDDGVLTSGRFRRTGAGGYTYVIAD